MAVKRARTLRRQMSPSEVRLWQQLRHRPGGFKFRRQHPSGRFVLDFFCHAAGLAIEVDGLAHDHSHRAAGDMRRDGELAARGIATLRISATDVRDNLDGVVEFILLHCRRRAPPPPPAVPLPAQPRGG